MGSVRLSICALLAFGCTRSDDAKDREITALRAQLAEKNSPSLPPIPVREPPIRISLEALRTEAIATPVAADTKYRDKRIASWGMPNGTEVAEDGAVAVGFSYSAICLMDESQRQKVAGIEGQVGGRLNFTGTYVGYVRQILRFKDCVLD